MPGEEGDELARLHAEALAKVAEADAHAIAGRLADARSVINLAMEASLAALELQLTPAGAHIERSFLAHLLGRWFEPGVPLPSEPIGTAQSALDVVHEDLGTGRAAAFRHMLVLAQTMRGEASTADLISAAEAQVDAAGTSHLETAEALSYLASHLEWLGDVGRAEVAVERARAELKLVAAGGDDFRVRELQLFVEQTAAHLLFASGRYSDAADAFKSLAPDYGSRGGAILATAATALLRAGRVEEARPLVAKARLALESGGPMTQWRADVIGIEAELSLADGHLDEAVVRVEEAMSALGDRSQPDLLWQLQLARARALRRLSRPFDALSSYLTAISAALVTRRASLGYELDSTSLREKRPLFDEAAELAVEVGDARACARIVESVKARALSALLATAYAATPESARPRSDLQRLSDAVDAVEHALVAAPPDQAAALAATRDGLWSERQALLDLRRREDPRWRVLTQGPQLDLDALIAVMTARHQAALSLFVTGSAIISVIVDGDGCVAGIVDQASAPMQRVQNYAANLVSPHPVAGAFDPSRAGIEADAFIPRELLERALSAQSLIISPHGVLHLVPWPAVPLRDERLFERCPIGVLPNLTCVLVLGSPATPPTGISLMGAPEVQSGPTRDLPGVHGELSDLAALYDADVRGQPVMGSAASQSAVLDALSADDTAILHLACHGRADPPWPMASGLEAADYFVDAADILDAGVGRDELVLSACSTGWRPNRVGSLDLLGDDVLGLPGALLEAGAISILVSIPPAEDRSMRRLTLLYHAGRRRGLTPLVALATAQRQLLAAGDPVWGWGGAVLYGCA